MTEEMETFNPDECNLKYEDQDGKIWRMKRTKNPRAFIREDGKKLSHTHVLFSYEYKGRAFYKESKPRTQMCKICFLVTAKGTEHQCSVTQELPSGSV